MPEELNSEVMKELTDYGNNLIYFMVDNSHVTAESVMAQLELARAMNHAASFVSFVPFEEVPVDGD